MKITWTLTHKAFPDAQPAPDFTAFDGDTAIGRVYQIESGPDRGLWLWAMMAVQREAPFPRLSNGRATEGGKAGLCVIKAYQSLLAQLDTRSTAA